MGRKALITGGAGFIGSHLTDHLLSQGYDVRILDSLESQVHPTGKRPDYLANEAELLVGRVKDEALLKKALADIEVVFHLGSAVGVGQSQYEIVRYTETNVLDTAVLLETLSKERGKVEKLVVASSMSLYGEGLFHCPKCDKERCPSLRPREQLKARRWELECDQCQTPMKPLPTPETKLPFPNSVYAINKRDQEEMCLAVGRAYKIPTVAPRFFNAFGSRQSLSNPYTGVAAIFAGRLMTKNRPIIFEDGGQTRDFIHISDLVRAIGLCAESPKADYQTINLGAGRGVSVLEVANTLKDALGSSLEPDVRGEFREGDTRHCFADASKAKELLGFEPSKDFAQGIKELLEWMETQEPEDQGDAAVDELVKRGLTG